MREGFGQDGKDSGFPAADPRVDEKVKAAILSFEKLGAEVEEISMPEHLQGYFIWSLIITLALQLHYLWTSESTVYHDSDDVMDDWFVNREHA